MKKKYLLWLVGVVLSGAMLSCSSSEEESIPEGVIMPISLTDGEIVDFFKSAYGADAKRQESFDFTKTLCNDEKRPCLIINNEDEFREAYTGVFPLPTIDFSKYSLVIGKVYTNAGTFLDNMSIKQLNDSKSVLTINYIIDTKGCYIAIVDYMYYWKIFPKFYTSEIIVEETISYGEVDDSKKREYE